MIPIAMTTDDWLNLFSQFMLLSLLGVGGVISAAPEMHRYLVVDQHWLTNSQFSSSISLAQAAPGPNILFVALMGWQIGINSGGASLSSGWHWGLLGALITMMGVLLPTSILAYLAMRWVRQHQDRLFIRAFKLGMTPIVVALMLSTGWLLAIGHEDWKNDWTTWLLAIVSCLVVWKTNLHILWLIGTGGLLGALGWL